MYNYSTTSYDIKEKLDIADIIGDHIELNKRGRDFWGLCPFHTENTPSFKVSQEKGFYYCFGCHESGDVISFIMKFHKVDFKTAQEHLATRAGIRTITQNKADYRRIKEAKQWLDEEQKIVNRLQSIINAEIKRLINIERWIYAINGLIKTEEILDIPIISWGVRNKDEVGFFLDELLGTDDAAAQLAIVRLSREVIAWEP